MNKDRNRLMLTLPNSGSTWFASLLARNLPGCKYYDKEFFNPICNMKHADVLVRNFGSELVSCYRNIARSGGDETLDDIRTTWFSEDYTFTKETYSPMKLEQFIFYFDCFAFLRKRENTFPPRRSRVWSFYEHAWHGLVEEGFALEGKTLEARAIEAHWVMQKTIIESAERASVPVLWFEELFESDDKVMEKIVEVTGMELPGLLNDIKQTRRFGKRPIQSR